MKTVTKKNDVLGAIRYSLEQFKRGYADFSVDTEFGRVRITGRNIDELIVDLCKVSRPTMGDRNDFRVYVLWNPEQNEALTVAGLERAFANVMVNALVDGKRLIPLTQTDVAAHLLYNKSDLTRCDAMDLAEMTMNRTIALRIRNRFSRYSANMLALYTEQRALKSHVLAEKARTDGLREYLRYPVFGNGDKLNMFYCEVLHQAIAASDDIRRACEWYKLGERVPHNLKERIDKISGTSYECIKELYMVLDMIAAAEPWKHEPEDRHDDPLVAEVAKKGSESLSDIFERFMKDVE